MYGTYTNIQKRISVSRRTVLRIRREVLSMESVKLLLSYLKIGINWQERHLEFYDR